MSVTAADLTIWKSVRLPLGLEEAFELFTAGVGTWWPAATHSIHGDAVAEVVLEPRVGGELYERTTSGDKARWATVTAWEPPYRLVLEWQVNPASPPTLVTVAFAADGDGTRVDLEHSGWEAYGEDAATHAADYVTGWDVVLGGYTGAACEAS